MDANKLNRYAYYSIFNLLLCLKITSQYRHLRDELLNLELPCPKGCKRLVKYGEMQDHEIQ
jgi:hypothetical protein